MASSVRGKTDYGNCGWELLVITIYGTCRAESIAVTNRSHNQYRFYLTFIVICVICEICGLIRKADQCSGISVAAGLKSVQSNRKRNFGLVLS
jgi:hypothetical protein